MSIKDKITPGPWLHRFAKWHSDGPTQGFSIKFGSKDVAAMNVSTSTPILDDDTITRYKMPSSECLSIAEAEANAKAISKVPDMLSIIERLAKLEEKKDTVGFDIEANDLIGEAEWLINELNQ